MRPNIRPRASTIAPRSLGLDPTTISTYEAGARVFADRYEAADPAELHRFVLSWFIPSAETADIGCGSGRDAAWLASHGFPVHGYDASPAMLAESARRHPEVPFAPAALPALDGIADAAFDNVLCCAVLMHLDTDAALAGVVSLARITRPGGRIVLSVRSGDAATERCPDGRLFTFLTPSAMAAAAARAGARVVAEVSQVDATRPDIRWTTMALERV